MFETERCYCGNLKGKTTNQFGKQKYCSKFCRNKIIHFKLNISEYRKKYRQSLKYKKASKDYMKKWRADEKNRDRERKKHNEYIKEQLTNNLNYKIAHTLRVRIKRAFKEYLMGKKTKSSGCINYQSIINHLYKSIPLDYGNKIYHIDHILPLCSFDFTNEEEIKKAFAPENHQWLTPEQNYKKIEQDKLLSIR